MTFSKSLSMLFIMPFCFLLVCAFTAQAGYIDNGDGTVTDTGTGLMWQKATAPGTYTWEAALVYCENLNLANHTDWRFPRQRACVSCRHKPVQPGHKHHLFPRHKVIRLLVVYDLRRQ